MNNTELKINQRDHYFRAWNDKTKEWLLGYKQFSNYTSAFFLMGECVMFGEWAKTFDKFLFEREGFVQSDLIITDFTGRTDKNGIKIFNGDIVKHRYRRIWKEEYHISVVEWNTEWCTYYLKNGVNNHRLRDDVEYEVLGNIFEHKIEDFKI